LAISYWDSHQLLQISLCVSIVSIACKFNFSSSLDDLFQVRATPFRFPQAITDEIALRTGAGFRTASQI
jgi:hypothetical protein